MIRIASLLCATMLALTACNGTIDARQGDGDASSDQPDIASVFSPAGLEVVALTITSGGKAHAFSVEIARSVQQQAKGMMFRTEMPPETGMIFPFDQVRPASFWMKDTPLSLDIIFVRADGTIESIAANATPYSLESVASGEPVAGVLELAAGRAAELGIEAGDKVDWPEPWDPAERSVR